MESGKEEYMGVYRTIMVHAVTRAALLRMLTVTGLPAVPTLGCRSRSAGPGLAAATPGTTQPVTLRMLVQGEMPGEWEPLTALYTQRTPNVTVQVETSPGGTGFTERGLALAAGGTPPDLSWASTRFAYPFFSSDVLVDLDEPIRRTRLDVRDIPQTAREEGMYGGKLYQLMSDVGYAMVAFNKTMLEAAARPSPWQLWEQREWNWERYIAEALEIARTTGGAEAGRFGTLVSTWDGEVFTIVRSFGGDVLDQARRRFVLDQPAGLEALEQWAAPVVRYRIAPLPGRDAPGFGTGRAGFEYYAQGRIARTRADAARNGFSWDVAPPPPRSGMVPTMFTNGYHLWRGSQEAAAWEFLAFLLSPPALLVRSRATGRMPSRLSLLEDYGRIMDIPAQDPASFVRLYPDLAKAGKGLPYTVNFTVWRQVLEDEVLLPVLRGERSAREAVQQAAPQINAELARA
jgi:ABC-type glycerol-3-phosphate transport system substrate-binding protein